MDAKPPPKDKDDDEFRDFPDRAIRRLLKRPAHLRALLNEVDPKIAALLDFENRVALEREHPQEKERKRESDLVFQVPLLGAPRALPALVYLMIEHQGRPSIAFPLPRPCRNRQSPGSSTGLRQE